MHSRLYANISYRLQSIASLRGCTSLFERPNENEKNEEERSDVFSFLVAYLLLIKKKTEREKKQS